MQCNAIAAEAEQRERLPHSPRATEIWPESAHGLRRPRSTMFPHHLILASRTRAHFAAPIPPFSLLQVLSFAKRLVSMGV